MRPILATISSSALRHNLTVVKKHAPQAKIMAVVKANGYGHGLVRAAQGLSAADGFAVLGLSEAVDLREAGFEQTVLLLEGVFDSKELAVAAAFSVDLVVHATHQIEMLESMTLTKPVHIHLKINSGMNRLGFTPYDFANAYQRLSDCNNVSDITLMTHFATADEKGGVSSALQVFQQTIQGLSHPVSLANSAAILLHPQTHGDWVRPGIMLYGANPISSKLASSFDLKPAMQLMSEIIGVQTLHAGESVGYGNQFTATKTTRVGIVACGYADGYPRHAPNDTPIAVCGKTTRTLGRVSMDMLFCDLSNIPEAGIGAKVELWGNQIAVDDVASHAGTIGYELLCAVSQRVPFRVID